MYIDRDAMPKWRKKIAMHPRATEPRTGQCLALIFTAVSKVMHPINTHRPHYLYIPEYLLVKE